MRSYFRLIVVAGLLVYGTSVRGQDQFDPEEGPLDAGEFGSIVLVGAVGIGIIYLISRAFKDDENPYDLRAIRLANDIQAGKGIRLNSYKSPVRLSLLPAGVNTRFRHEPKELYRQVNMSRTDNFQRPANDFRTGLLKLSVEW